MKKVYPRDFKAKILNELRNNKVSEISRKYNIPISTICTWKTQKHRKRNTEATDELTERYKKEALLFSAIDIILELEIDIKSFLSFLEANKQINSAELLKKYIQYIKTK